jgi:hypothetical protein
MTWPAPPGNDASRSKLRCLSGPVNCINFLSQNLTHDQTAASDVIRVPLSTEQARQLAPLVHRAAEQGENVIFVATAIPYWSSQDQTVVWELQPTVIPARLGQKIKKLVLGWNS